MLAAETAPFGIRTLVVEPGGFATDWAGPSTQIHEVPAEYEETVGTRVRLMDNPVVIAGDPDRAGEIMARVVKRDKVPSHLVLGAYAVDAAREYSHRQLAEQRNRRR